MIRVFLLATVIQLMTFLGMAQKRDSLSIKGTQSIDTAILAKKGAAAFRDSFGKSIHSPRKATIRSAIIPGWGQAYNKKYWKIPIVYAAIGVPVGTFLYNKKWYNKTRDAARMLGSDPIDTANYRQRVDVKLHIFFTNPERSLPSLLNYRNEFRRSMDYSILFILLTWGLNVVDATVDGHLKEFDVSDDLSFHIKPTILSGSTAVGLSLVFSIGRNSPKTITSLR
ncbi:MAG: DUF5683 domain-containing protein [Chitinophagaceae bacterium]